MSLNVSSWSIRNPTPGILLFVLLTLAGLMGFSAMRVQNFPDIDLSTVTVTASLPGASPSQLETDVARKIENSLAAVQGVKHIDTTLTDGTAIISVEFRLEKPTQEAVDAVRDAVARVRGDLPGDLRDPVIQKVTTAGSPILTYTVASARMDEEALSWFVDDRIARTLGGWHSTRRRRTSPDSCGWSSRRPQAAAPTWAVSSSKCAPSPRCNRPKPWAPSNSCWATDAL